MNITGGGSSTLAVGYANAASIFSGTIESTGGSLTLAKIASGTFTLSGSDTCSGNTFVDGGKLALTSTGSITNSTVIVDGGTLSNSGAITQSVQYPILLSDLGVTDENEANETDGQYAEGGENPNNTNPASDVISLSATFAIPNLPFTITVDWGDGQPPQTCSYSGATDRFEINHYYSADPATRNETSNYYYTLTAQAATNVTAVYHGTATYASVPPLVSISEASEQQLTYPNNNIVDCTANVCDPGETGTYTYDWTAEPIPFDQTYVQEQSGPSNVFTVYGQGRCYAVYVTVTNHHGLPGTATPDTIGTGQITAPITSTPTVSISETDDSGEVQAGSDAHFAVTVAFPEGTPPGSIIPYPLTVFYDVTDGTAAGQVGAAQADQDYTAEDSYNDNIPVRGPQALVFPAGFYDYDDFTRIISIPTSSDPVPTAKTTFDVTLEEPQTIPPNLKILRSGPPAVRSCFHTVTASLLVRRPPRRTIVDTPETNRIANCDCQTTTNDDGRLSTNAPTIPGGANLSNPDANGPDFQVTQPRQLTIGSAAAAVTSQDGEVQVWDLSNGVYTAVSTTTVQVQGARGSRKSIRHRLRGNRSRRYPVDFCRQC